MAVGPAVEGEEGREEEVEREVGERALRQVVVGHGLDSRTRDTVGVTSFKRPGF